MQTAPISQPRLTLEESLKAFLAALEGKNRSGATLKAYRIDLYQFIIWLKENNLAATSPSRIEKADLTEYLTYLSRLGLTGKTRARKLAAVREYFRHLLNHELITRSPADGIETPKQEKRSRDFLQRSEYNTFLSLAGSNVRDFAMFQVFLQTGVRVSELVELAVDDIDFVGRTLRVREGKGKAARAIPLEQKALKAIKNYLAVRGDNYPGHLFLNRYGEPIGERGIQKLVAHYCTQAGLTKRASPHIFRHTFATHKAKNGVSPYKLKDWLGHANLNTTQIYVHMAEDNTHRLMEQTSL
jgi:site-specific recombinase XerD